MGVHIVHSLHELADDMETVTRTLKRSMVPHVRDVARDGNREGKRTARRSSGTHGKHYPKAFTVERKGQLEYEWGPDAAMPQGGMSFERGSRNQPPHHDIAKAADTHGADALARKVRVEFGELFWP